MTRQLRPVSREAEKKRVDAIANKSFRDERVGRGRRGRGLMRIATIHPRLISRSVCSRFNGTIVVGRRDYSISFGPRVNVLLMSVANDAAEKIGGAEHDCEAGGAIVLDACDAWQN